MKEKILALVMCSVLATTLFACGERRGSASSSDISGNEQHDSTSGSITTDRTATWEQMLQNGRVHDTDGFLWDGENSHWL